jgi:hypothetical protein
MNHFRSTASFAVIAGGYTGDNPVILNAFEEIRQSGIREARKQHDERKTLVDEMKQEPALLAAAIWPAPSLTEAIENANRVIFNYRNIPTWRQPRERERLLKAKQTRVIARFFRRFGKALWIRSAA